VKISFLTHTEGGTLPRVVLL